jgi:hypothetical protein
VVLPTYDRHHILVPEFDDLLRDECIFSTPNAQLAIVVEAPCVVAVHEVVRHLPLGLYEGMVATGENILYVVDA